MNQPALIVIDVQNDYFADGAFPLWQADAALSQVEAAVAHARAHHVPVILVQHIAAGPAPFFNRDSHGVAIHPRLLAAAPHIIRPLRFVLPHDVSVRPAWMARRSIASADANQPCCSRNNR